MSFIKTVCIIFLSISVIGCDASRIETYNRAKEVGLDQLVLDLRKLGKERSTSVVSEGEWTEAIKKMNPISVEMLGEFGVFLVVRDVDHKRQGLYVPLDPAYVPQAGSGEEYSVLEKGVYWSSIKTRERWPTPK